MKKIISVLLMAVLIATNAITAFASNQDNISFQEFYTTLQSEYEKYSIDFTIKDPNLDYTYTQEYLDEQLQIARSIGESIKQVNDEELACLSDYKKIFPANQGNIVPYVMPVQYSWSDEYNVESVGFPGYCYVQVLCTGTVDVQTGNVITANSSARKRAGLNVKSSNFTTDTYKNGSMVTIVLGGSVSFEYTEPKTNSTFSYDAYGPFALYGFTPEDEI